MKMHELNLLVLMVLLIFCSTNSDAASQEDELNRLTLLSRLEADSNSIQHRNSKYLSHSRSALRNYGNPKCVSEGRMADPDDCGQYYDCVRDKNGYLFANKQHCFGHAFDATRESCVPATLAKGCILGSTNVFRSVPVNNPKLQTICKSHDNEFICMDCKTLIMCVDRKPYIIPCKSGNVCYNKENFKGGVCYPDAPLECTCDKDDIFRKDYYDSSKFLSCDKKGADPVIQSCPDGLEFNVQRRTCGTPIDTSCSEVGTFALKSDCKQFHTCIKTTSGWFQRNLTCTGKTMYNEKTGQCEDPCDWYDGNFVCKEEGRFQNLRDCTTFFECIQDPSDNNKFIQIEHVCPEGYEWLPWINRHHCIAKGSTRGRCEPQFPNICEIPSGWCSKDDQTTAPTTSTTTTASAITTTPLPPISGETTLAPGSISPDVRVDSPKCFSEGRIADPGNCGQYYDCVRDSRGGFTANKQSCFGYAFDAARKQCVAGREAKGCIIDSRSSTVDSRLSTVDDPNLQTICKSYDNEFICMDCKTLIMCVDRKPHVIPCKSGNVCYNDKASFKGGVCYPDAPLDCTCHNDDIFKQDYYNPSKFLSCDSKGADPVVQSCPAGLEFNEKLTQCGYPVDTTCSESGTFALKTDCTNYHTCIYTSTGWFQRHFTCTGKTMYNENTGKCEDPCAWYDGNFMCKEEGRFPNPEDCSTFFECIEHPADPSKFYQLEHVCPEGYEWLPMVNRHHCVAKGSTKERCVPQKPNICEIPVEWCLSTTAQLPTTIAPTTPTTTTETTTIPTTTTTAAPTTTIAPTPSELCTAAGGSTLLGQQCLMFSSRAMPCVEAEADCVARGGALASIVDYAGISASLLSKYAVGETFWIGASDTYDVMKDTSADAASDLHLYMLALEDKPHFSYHTCGDSKEYICELGIPQDTSSLATPGTRSSCPHDHFQVGSQCFFIPTEGFKTWYAAQEFCEEQGGILAEPDSIPEFYEALSKQTSGYGFWLGGSNRKQGGKWRWESRSAMVGNHDSWYPEATNMYDTSEKCLLLMRGKEKPLTARSCGAQHHYFICEKH